MGGQPLWNKPGIESNYGQQNLVKLFMRSAQRMGKKPKESVVDQFERMHDVDNVFVVDAGPFVSQADKKLDHYGFSMEASTILFPV